MIWNQKMETMSRSNTFVNHMDISVPIYSVSFTVSYTFGNTKQQFQQHQTRIESDYIEQKSQVEVIQGVGNMAN